MDLRAEQHVAIATFSATLPFLPDAERVRLRCQHGSGIGILRAASAAFTTVAALAAITVRRHRHGGRL